MEGLNFKIHKLEATDKINRMVEEVGIEIDMSMGIHMMEDKQMEEEHKRMEEEHINFGIHIEVHIDFDIFKEVDIDFRIHKEEHNYTLIEIEDKSLVLIHIYSLEEHHNLDLLHIHIVIKEYFILIINFVLFLMKINLLTRLFLIMQVG